MLAMTPPTNKNRPDGDRPIQPASVNTANDDFRREADFSSQLPRLFRGFTLLAGSPVMAAAIPYSISDSFEMHYDTRRDDEATARHPSGGGVGFAKQPVSSHSDHVATSFERNGNPQMPRYHHLLNEVLGAAETESSAPELALDNRGNGRAAEGSDREGGGLALLDRPGPAYNEEAFQYFLEMERKRSELSNRPFLLMLVDFNKHPQIDSKTADKLFSVLSLCLRETDFIGWYREGHVAGAVLTQHGEPDGDDLSDVVRQRIGEALRQRLPSDLARQLQARVYQIPAHVKPGSK
jgi:hypothetical protein